MTHWLLRMKRWAQNPPSSRQVLFVLAIIGFALALYAVERVFGWPEALTVERLRM